MSRVVVGNSAWIEYLRAPVAVRTTSSAENVGLKLATTEPVRMELLAGAARAAQAAAAEKLMLDQHWLQPAGPRLPRGRRHLPGRPGTSPGRCRTV